MSQAGRTRKGDTTLPERLPRSSAPTFLRGVVRAWGTVGAVAPTSRGVARRLAHLAEIRSARQVAEFGPGTGAITGELLAALPVDGRLWAYEIYAPFVEHLERTVDDPRLTVVAESALAIAQVHGDDVLPSFDAVVSSLPFSLMEPAETGAILRATANALRPGGIFVALQYHPRYLPPLLRAEFEVVDQEIYPWNIPPAMLLRARKPGTPV